MDHDRSDPVARVGLAVVAALVLGLCVLTGSPVHKVIVEHVTEKTGWSPGWKYGDVPTAEQWNAAFAHKADVSQP